MATVVPTDEELQRMYENKKNSCADRLIGFELTFDEYKALYKTRHLMKCFYTDTEFRTKDSTNPAYPTIDRIDSKQPYKRGNVVFCTSKVNALKNNYIELSGSRKGLSRADAHIIARIEKVLEQPSILASRMAVYDDLFAKVDERMAEKEEASQAVVERDIKAEKKTARKEAFNKHAYEHELAEQYNLYWKQFNDINKILSLTFKEFRDIMRAKHCRISGLEFEKDSLEEGSDSSWGDRSFFVIDKSQDVITKDNIILCKKRVQEGLDYASMGDVTLLNKIGNKLCKL